MPDYLNKNGFTYTAQELEEYAQQENMGFDDYLKSKSFTEVDTQVDPKINPETGQEYTFMEKASNIFEPNIPGILNLGEQFAQTGAIAIDKMFETMLPKGGRVSNFIEKVAKKYGGVPEDVEFDSGTLIDQILYVTGDYDRKPGEAFGKIKLPSTMTEEEREELRKAGTGELDVLGKVIKHEQDIIDKRLEGKGGYTGEGFFGSNAEDKVLAGINALNGVVMTVVPAMLTQGRSLGPQIALPMISNYNKEKAKFLYGENDQDALRKLGEDNGFELATPAVLGYIAYGLEKLQFKGITNYMTKQAFKPGRFVKLFQTGITNGTQEAFQGLTENLNIRLAKGEARTEALGNTFSDDLFSEEFFENFMLGVVGGTGVASGGAAITRALKADEQTSVKLSGFIDEISGLQQLKAKTTSEETLKKIDKKLKQTEEAFVDYINENNNLQDYLTGEQETSLRSILKSKDKNQKDLENLYKDLRSNKITKEEFDLAYNEIKIEQAENDAAIVKIKTDANMALLKQDLDKQGKFVGDIDGLEIEDYNTQDEFFEALEKEYKKIGKKMPNYRDSNVLINGIKVGNKFLVNNTVAAETNATGVGIHEIIHGVVKSTLQEDDGTGNLSVKGEKLVKSFISQLSAKELRLIEAELEGGKYKTNKDGTEKQFKEYGEEYVTIYTQLLKEGRFSKNGLQKFGSWFSNILNKETPFKKISFEDGNAIKSFLDAFVKGDATALEQAKELAREGVKMKQTVEESRAKLVDTINDLQQGATTKAEFQKPSVFNKVFEAIQSGGAINNYIRSLKMSPEKTQETIDAVTDRLINFDPAAKRKDGTVIGSKGLGEFIMANVGFGKLVAAKKLAVEGEKRKRTTSIDDPDVTDIPDDTPTPTTKTKGVETKLKQTKARQLTSLADLDVESSPLIKEATKVELKKLIESNPKNLIEQIQKVLIPDLVEITRKEMGVIGQVKGELNIPDTYLAYLSDTYQKTISSMEIQKIRSNYKNLFKKEKMGFADYKTKKSDKPSLKKDSNYRKEIFRNVTTKAEFVKYHTEGKKNKLIANQRNLAIMRAEAEVVRAAENYIIENSQNLNEIYGAELRNFVDSKTIEKQKQEDKSFDSVKYSKSMALAAFELRDAVLTAENVFDNNGNLIGPYKNILKNKKDSKAVGDFVWANLHLLSPDTDFRFLVKAYEKLYSEDRGTEYETNLIQTAIKAEKTYGIDALEVVLRKPTERDALPDMIFKIHGEVMNVEAKMAKAQYSSVTNSIVDGNMVVEKQYSPEFMKILNQLQKESQKGIKKAKKFLKENGIEWDGFKLLSTEGHNMLKNTIDPDTGSSYFNGISATLPLPLKFIAEIYNNKKHPVYLMQLMGRGLFSMGGDTFNLGIPALEDGGDGFITLRVSSNSQKRVATEADVKAKRVKSIYTDGTNTKKKGEKKTKRQVKTGNKIYSYRSIPGISDKVLNDMKSNHNIENLAGMMKLMDSKEVANIKTRQESKNKQTLGNAIKMSRSAFDKFQAQKQKGKEFVESILKKPKGITVLDFDDTLATTKSLVKYTTPEGKTGTLNAEQYASTYEDLLDQGYTFDFSDFNKVVKGKLAPLFNKAMKLQGKFGPENMFVLTARPPQAAKAIFDFLKANGLNIPIKNITGLGNSTSEAKALWIADKVGEGYNDFYFADDALQNVQAVKNMLDQFDVKSKVQQAKVKFSKSMDTDFNKILEEITGIEADKRFSDTKARKRGESKGKFRFFIPPSHEDFVGLLYNFMGKGRKGDQHRNFFEQALIRPLNRAYREIDTAKQAIANDYKSLNKQFPEVKKKLIKNTPDGDFTFQDAIRVYLWNKHGYTIPGLSKTDQQNLVDIVMNDSELRSYAETINVISKQETYVDPGPNWETGNIRIDLVDATGRVGRASYFTEFNENADIIFSPENLNKIEAGYGKAVREALEDMLHRIKTGVNRPKGASAKPNMFMNWLNASVSGVMFFNTRSALLQQMSNVNFLNFADNNIYAAAKAFANQPQYWKDFAMIFNSDMLKQRRGGLQTDINGAEMAEAIKKARPDNLFDQVAIITGKALKLGFLPTQIGDNIAIATGGATFYRNRVNKYIKDGLSKKEAEDKAFIDLQDITNATQQSARPDMTSAQQAAWVGKLILNFLNTPSQYNRIIKKAASDIKNRRITPPNTNQTQSDMSNASRILYYGAAQNLIFYGLQTALFAVMFGLENDDEERRAQQVLKKKERVINGAIDTILRGSGIYGVAVSTIKNMTIKFLEQREKGYNKDESAVLMEALNFSPVVGIRARSIVNAEKELNYNMPIIKEMSMLDIDNPMWPAVTNYIQVTGFPANRIYQKTINLRNAADNQYTAFQRTMFFSGYTTWSLNLGDTQKMKDIKEKVKGKKKSKKKKTQFKTFKFK
jgi:hypothetical protein